MIKLKYTKKHDHKSMKCNREHCIEAFEVPLKGLESVVRKVNRHKKKH